MELVSIIMPAYNAEKYIEASILSVCNQTYTNWELLIVNDGSRDNTQDIAESYSHRDHRIKVINQENKKLGGARNTGLKNSSGEWIAFLDSDDLWEPSKLEKQLQTSKQFPDADVIYTAGWTFNENDIHNLTPYEAPIGNFPAVAMYARLLAENVVPVLSVLVKKRVINIVGYQEENPFFHGCEDWDYWLRMAINGANFYGIKEKLFYYRRHGNNMSAKSLQIAQAAVLLKNFAGRVENKLEVRSGFKKIINPLITRLITEGRTSEASYLLKGMRNIGSGWDYAINTLLVNFMGKYSAMPVRLLMRLNKLFSK
jgi:teichuronic acid biosynthesis glycosyltransferase TuaG